MTFQKEANFEESLINALQQKGWTNEVLKNPTEEDLIQNWANILFENNRSIDRLNDAPLTRTEMDQILNQIRELRTSVRLNSFINGKTVSIKRDNPNDDLHFDKEISLKIYDRHEIAAGQSRYQIVQQPIFRSRSPMLNDRRGDLMLLINGMPVIHIELKKSGIPISQACNQIEKYAHEGIFTGIYFLVQIFVAMNPENCVYFANPGPDGKFRKEFFFHWADFNNDPINSWKKIASDFLSIPMAHQLIGFYTVADGADGILKIMRSYQYHAANQISDKVAKMHWGERNQLGGYIWHTTGSGKTMTSFKSAQLIANSKDADKVVFLVDRIELGTQSLYEYRSFADTTEEIQATEDTHTLIDKLKSNDPANTLIVTSIQKMSRIKVDEDGLNNHDIEKINKKRIVFIVDEAHRSTFGDMLITIKQTLPNAVFFGFTGTPISTENAKKSCTTSMVFGDELHKYTIADGIRDKNVLGFYLYKINTFRDSDLRKAVALKESSAANEKEAMDNPDKKKIYLKYLYKTPMAGTINPDGSYEKGIEDYIKTSQYNQDSHRRMVVRDIAENWITLSQNGKFHAIFAASSIVEAIHYYRLMKTECPTLKVTALFDPHIDNNGDQEGVGALFKEDGLVEILSDYNKLFGQDFSIPTHDKFKKDVSSRMSHKRPYERIEKIPEEQLDILIVVDQMLTGFDSKWVNTLYLDKVLQYENIIQAFSRTNRLFGPDKPFGVIRYYRYPNTMERNIAVAVKHYSGDRKVDLFANHLPYNIRKMNEITQDIRELFKNAGIKNYEKLPEDMTECGKFATLFAQFNKYLEPAKIQGFVWDKSVADKDQQSNAGRNDEVKSLMTKDEFNILVQRYKELVEKVTPSPSHSHPENFPWDIDPHLSVLDTEPIDNNYMNSRFVKYLKQLEQKNISPEELQNTLNELHKSFARLTQEEQKFANIFLHDVESGDVVLVPEKTFRDYITEYQANAKNQQILALHNAIGVDVNLLEKFLNSAVTEKNLDEYGRFSDLEKTIDKEKSKAFFEKLHGEKLSLFLVNRESSALLRKFVLSGGFDIVEKENPIYEVKTDTLGISHNEQDYIAAEKNKKD